ncbi:MAG: pilus assembly protein TadG-related protein [Acidimicrobiia bacterium]
MNSERGSVTIWMLGLCLMMLLLGGLSLDLWRAFSDRRSLASAADAAAVAGASAIDIDTFRATNEVQLNPELAEARARASLAAQLDQRALRGARIQADLHHVVVEAQGRVEFTLLNLIAPGDNFEVRVRATAEPRASG